MGLTLFIQLIDSIEIELVEMDIEIDGTAKALDESDDSGLSLRF